MNYDWQDILRKLLSEHGIKQEKLAERFDVTPSAFNHWVNKRRDPKFNIVLRMLYSLGLRKFEFDENGRISVDSKEFESAITGIRQPAAPTSPEGMSLPELRENARLYPILATRTDIEKLPGVPPGVAYMSSKTPVIGHGFWVMHKGESMSDVKGVSVPDNSLVLFDNAITPIDGNLCLFFSPNSPSLMFRRYIEDCGQGYIGCVNPKYPTVELPRTARCLGTAVECRQVLKVNKPGEMR